MLTHLGGTSIAQALPVTTLAMAPIGLALPQLTTQAAALTLAIKTPVLPDVDAVVASLQAAVLNAADSLLNFPQAQVDMTATVGVELALLSSAIGALLQLQGQLMAAAGVGGIHLYSYDGTAAAMGGEVSAQIGGGVPGGMGPSAPLKAIMLVTESPATFEALSLFVKTS